MGIYGNFTLALCFEQSYYSQAGELISTKNQDGTYASADEIHAAPFAGFKTFLWVG